MPGSLQSHRKSGRCSVGVEVSYPRGGTLAARRRQQYSAAIAQELGLTLAQPVLDARGRSPNVLSGKRVYC
jgi:hypothetical protein